MSTFRTLPCDNFEVISGTAAKFLETAYSIYDIVFIDPPFNSDVETSVLDSLANNKTLMRSCKIYLEFSKFSSFQIPETFSVLKEKNVGDVRALFLKYDNKNSI